MADQPDPNFPPYRDSETAPIIYFDVIAGTGVMHGAVQIELASRILTPMPDGPVQIGFMATGRIRCSSNAAKLLRDAVDQALKMLEQPQQGPTASTGRLN